MTPPPRRRLATLILALAVPLCAAACGSSGGSSSNTGGSANPGSKGNTGTSGAPVELYVSLGDSYAAGYQPSPTGNFGGTSTSGFVYQVPGLAVARGYHLKVVNFGCGGATTVSILHSTGCPQLGPGAPTYPDQTQAVAAEAFIRAHRSEIGLITVSIGGNDILPCASASSVVTCVTGALKNIQDNLGVLLRGLRQAAGPSVTIIGTTYPDIILGLLATPHSPQSSLADLSVVAFKDLINPALKSSYLAVHGEFVDVTAATGAYGSMKTLVDDPPYGRIPEPVARVCQLTYFCNFHDIHPTTAGYKLIAQLIVAALPPKAA